MIGHKAAKEAPNIAMTHVAGHCERCSRGTLTRLSSAYFLVTVELVGWTPFFFMVCLFFRFSLFLGLLSPMATSRLMSKIYCLLKYLM
jgi:hypothetical protein